MFATQLNDSYQMEDNTLKIVTWNTRGYGSLLRRRTIRNFIRRKENEWAIIALQELKVTDKTKLEARLRATIPGAEVIIDYTISGRGGAALLIPPKWTVKNREDSGTGNAAWATIETCIGEINIMAIHAPNTKDQRTIMWENLDSIINTGRWMLAGDYNMVELGEDSKGKTAMMTGGEARAWKNLANRNGLIDTYLCTATTKEDVGNAQRKWQKAWIRIRTVLKHEKKKAEEEKRQHHDLKHELRELREAAEQNQSEPLLTRIKYKEGELRIQEHEDARAWRLRSKTRWLKEGEAPSRYFFAQLKAKFANETMNAIQLQDGTTTTDREAITKEVHRIHTKPSDGEIDTIAQMMKTKKSLGLDGLTAEFLHECWDFVRSDCIAMIHHFWDCGELLKGIRTAVIKMIPKSDNKTKLTNWRPLSVMTLTYKLIAKLMAERLKKLIPALVDTQQAGFIKGRSITSNLLSLRLGIDWDKMSNQTCMFLKLDFIKAYDRVNQNFLMQVLRTMGFTEKSMTLFRGLTVKGKAKPHVNLDFSDVIDMQRGVRHGCPLAPYLFTLVTQVLMEMIKTQVSLGRITGLQIPQGSDLVHQLYADDTGIFIRMDEQVYNNTMLTLKTFELASGARLNLNKTVIIPITDEQVPTWLTNTQCTILGPSERMRYLGILAGKDMLELEITQDLKRRNINGNAKKPLIGWATFARSKKDGGLGWPQMEETADAFLLKNATKIIQEKADDWVKIAEAIITTTVRNSSRSREIKTWSPSELMLGLNSLKTPQSQILNRMLGSWFKVKKKLAWRPDEGPHPTSASPLFITNTFQTTQTADVQEARSISHLCRKAKVSNLNQFHDNAGDNISIVDFCNTRAITLTETQTIAVSKMETVFPPDEKQEMEWHRANGWVWPDRLRGSDSSPKSERGGFFVRVFFTNAKAKDWGLDSRVCGRCQMEIESVPRALWYCPRTLERQRWISWIFFEDQEKTTSQAAGENLMRIFDRALGEQSRSPAHLLLLTTVIRANWEERNAKQFDHSTKYKGIHQILSELIQEIRAITSEAAITSRKQEQLKEGRALASYWIQQTGRWLIGTATRTSRTPNDADLDDLQSQLHHIMHGRNDNTQCDEDFMIHCDIQMQADLHTDLPNGRSSRHQRAALIRRPRSPQRQEARQQMLTPHATDQLRLELLEWLNPEEQRPALTSSTPQPTSRAQATEDTWITYRSIQDLLTAITGRRDT
ncbi:hypothetical protein R1sor_018971 [Riccia sorocarpa]|uniref:Reverse transcriptase domain-containing protein n=1 Tax=Riccia sorocarpa TaxID=122646 RepID=A0ABD3IEJ2_9MARC